MPTFSEAYGFLRFTAGLRKFLREPVSVPAAKEMVRWGMENREARFVENLEHGVFAHPRSPYRKLFQAAGCELGDVRRMVRQQGVEGTLRQLLEAGVYVSWEEFKGQSPAIRGTQSFHFREEDFDNPSVRLHYEGRSGGTTGVPVRTRMDLDNLAESAPNWAVWFSAHGWMDRPLIFWTHTLAGLANRYLKCARFGKPYLKWFAMAGVGDRGDCLRSALVHGAVRFLAGYSKPEPAPLQNVERVGRYLVELLREGEKPLVNTTPSAAARLSLLMRERGESLAGVSFLLGAEPVTAARKSTIEASGAKAFPTYGTSESGWVGAQFPGAAVADEVHIFRDAYAVIQQPAATDESDNTAPVLFTSLRRAGPKVLINTGIGDSAVIETGCQGRPRETFGYDVRMHTIRSLQKITAWGVTFARADLYRILEEVLPKRFGGGVGDYQLLEEQDEYGLSRLKLLVDPAIGELHDDQVRKVFLEELGRLRSYYVYMGKMLSDADALWIERRQPVATLHGKILPVLTHRGG